MKPDIIRYFGLLLMMMSGINCKYKSDYPDPVPTPLYVGKSYEGGVIAYILQPGDIGYTDGVTHGIIAATHDLDSSVQWGCEGTYLGATDTLLGYGGNNTNKITGNCIATTSAAQSCADIDFSIYDDWYLPDQQELNQLFLNRVKIGGFDLSATYWTSSESGTKMARARKFSDDGTALLLFKSQVQKVRPIRYF